MQKLIQPLPTSPIPLSWASLPSCAALFPLLQARHLPPADRLCSLHMDTRNLHCSKYQTPRLLNASTRQQGHPWLLLNCPGSNRPSQPTPVLNLVWAPWWCGISHSSKWWFHHLRALSVVFCFVGLFVGCFVGFFCEFTLTQTCKFYLSLFTEFVPFITP